MTLPLNTTINNQLESENLIFGKRGYDVIQDCFFVELINSKPNNEVKTFTDFSSYYSFLNGDIYDDAYYFQYNFTFDELNKYKIDKTKINYLPFGETISNCKIKVSDQKRKKFREREKDKKKLVKKVDIVNRCSNSHELIKEIRCWDREFYLWNYITHHGKESFDVIMDVINDGYADKNLKKASIFLYGIEKCQERYNCRCYKPKTNKKYNDKYKKYANKIKKDNLSIDKAIYFDKRTHFYCVETIIDTSPKRHTLIEDTDVHLFLYFSSFDELATYLHNDLSDCDLSDNYKLKIDLSKYQINNNTKLPIKNLKPKYKKVIKRYTDDKFKVTVEWFNSENNKIFEREFIFNYFFEFVAFLEKDLSDSDLIECDGLKNVKNFSELNLNKAKLRGEIYDIIGVKYKKSTLVSQEPQELDASKNNETSESIRSLELQKDNLVFYDMKNRSNNIRISYITDIHLPNRLKDHNCKTKEDCLLAIRRIVYSIYNSATGRFLLIGGDISYDFSLFNLFIRELKKANKYYDFTIIFVLGNHELWNHEDKNLIQIVEEYRKLIEKNGMYLLYNDLLYTNVLKNNKLNKLTADELISLDDGEVIKELRQTNLIILGGTGFSGYNEHFNANHGIYKNAISRNQEIDESLKIERVYDKLLKIVPKNNVIIFTHMPFCDWHRNQEFHEHYVYVSGHTHRNEFHDDGSIRIYRDNQVGYKSNYVRSKYFNLEKAQDIFLYYPDGIYDISKDDYVNFYKAKNIKIVINRDNTKLYMLKKNKYYCFIEKSEAGKLCILNGGKKRRLTNSDINYYYENMDKQISSIKNPLSKYRSIQQIISNFFKAIGGTGTIHGAIVDLNYSCHVYINPLDLKVTPYFALDMVTKIVYQNLETMVMQNVPHLYANYMRYLETSSNDVKQIIVFSNNLNTEPELYLSTDIYEASREISKMQKIYANILSIWNEDALENEPLRLE